MSSVLYVQSWLIGTGPYAVLAVVGIVLFWRYRSLGAALFALGFIVYVVGQLSGSFIRGDVSKTYNSHGDVTSVVESFHGWAWTLRRYGGTVGMWLAAAGGLLQVLRAGRAGSATSL
jgi:hypothetical protein